MAKSLAHARHGGVIRKSVSKKTTLYQSRGPGDQRAGPPDERRPSSSSPASMAQFANAAVGDGFYDAIESGLVLA